MTLIERLSKLDGPDREVDAEVYIQFNIPAERAGRIDYAHGMVGWWPKDGTYVSAVTVPAYTASVDAALALAERLFPGTEYEFTNLYNIVRVTIEMNGKYGGFHGEHVNSLPIALCIAILRAKEASK
ncbi:hypothetical protein [Brucella pseudogrignonensis]|uniref:hypothetical protein n=1 Tax=Brucella pseudogrignonensis TaxID=419475 RepID=UPI003ECDAAD3